MRKGSLFIAGFAPTIRKIAQLNMVSRGPEQDVDIVPELEVKCSNKKNHNQPRSGDDSRDNDEKVFNLLVQGARTAASLPR